jgi:hypothetical protein
MRLKSPEHWAREATLSELTSAVRALEVFDEASVAILDSVYVDRSTRLLAMARELPMGARPEEDLRRLADHLERAAHDAARAELERLGDYFSRWRLLAEMLLRAAASLETPVTSLDRRPSAVVVLGHLQVGRVYQRGRRVSEVERYCRDLLRDDLASLESLGLLHPRGDDPGSELQPTSPARQLGRRPNATRSLYHLASAHPGGPPATPPDTFWADLRAMEAAGLARRDADQSASLTNAGLRVAWRPGAWSLLQKIAAADRPWHPSDIDALARSTFQVDLRLLLAWELAYQHGDGDHAELTISRIGRRALAEQHAGSDPPTRW